MVTVNGVPPIGFTRVAVIAETAEGARMVYYLDPSRPVNLVLDSTWPDYGPEEHRVHMTGWYAGMDIWQGPMPGDPPAAIEPMRREIAS